MRKKIYSTLLSIAVLTAHAPCVTFADADTVHIKTPSKISAGSTFSVQITSSDSEFEYQWLISDSEDGEYTELLSDKSATYVVTPRDKGKYIKVRILNVNTGEATLSDNSVCVESLGPVSRTGFGTADINATMLTPEENVFTVDGRKFVLLDEMNDSSSHYYIMTDETYGTKQFDENSYAKFDPDMDGNIGKFLNGDFLTVGGADRVLPESVQQHIDFDHIWNTEAGMTGGDCPADYSFKAGISLLSQSEAIKYRSKYGWQPGGSDVITPWWGRTQRGAGGSADNILVMMGSNDSGKGNMWDRSCTQSFFVRPTFYLDEDFFGQVKCNALKMGDNIKKLITEKYTVSDLEDVYSVEELIAIGYKIKSTVISKDTNPYGGGIRLTAQMNDEDAVDFKYKWFISDTETEQGKQVYGNTTDTYIAAVNDRTKYITATVIPVYSDGSVGEETAAVNKIYIDNIGAMSRTDYTSDDRRANRDNPKEYMFTANGEQMILLDAYDDDLDTLYVMTANAKGQHMYDSDNTQKFDAEDLNNIAYWLNHDFLNGSTSINTTVQKYINKEHLWWTEAGHNKGNCPEDYSFTTGVSLLSRSEYSKYWGKFGWDNNESIKIAWWLRTGRNTGVSDIYRVLGVQDGNYSNVSANGYGNTWNKEANASQYVRPVFYLTKDFLQNVKISEMGEKAAEAIRNYYTPEQFMSFPAGYTKTDLIKLGIIEQPKAANVKTDGRFSVGAQIKGSYSYIGEKAESGTVCGFEAADKEDGEYKKVADGAVYKIASGCEKQYLRFFVTPVNADGIKGATYYSPAYKVLGMATVSAEDVKVTDNYGKEVSDLSGVDQLKVSAKLVNCMDITQTVWVMLFVYDSNDIMLGNKGMAVTISPESEVVCNTLSMQMPTYSEGNYAKLIIWDGLETMNPAQNESVLLR